mmetsp:Transcript_28676/g.66477  ORF Transcript_28676/g.66477 Transcript_28676/m.66477 type:complete len:378 (-) Transcript_28676:450-1583(-)
MGQLRFHICEVLLQLRDLVISILELLQGTHVLAVRHATLQAIFLPGLVETIGLLDRLLHIELDLLHVLLQLLSLLIMNLHNLGLVLGPIVATDQRAVQGFPVPQEVGNGLAVALRLLFERVDLADEILCLCAQHSLGDVHLMASFIVQRLAPLQDVQRLLRLVPLGGHHPDLLVLGFQFLVQPAILLADPLPGFAIFLLFLLEVGDGTQTDSLLFSDSVYQDLLRFQRLLTFSLDFLLLLDFALDLFQGHLSGFHGLLQLSQLAFQTVSAARLSFLLRPLSVEHVLHICDFNLALHFLRLISLSRLRQHDVIVRQRRHLRFQLVTRFDQLISLCNQAVDSVFLVHTQARTLFDKVAKVRNLHLEVVDCLLGPLLFLV